MSEYSVEYEEQHTLTNEVHPLGLYDVLYDIVAVLGCFSFFCVGCLVGGARDEVRLSVRGGEVRLSQVIRLAQPAHNILFNF